MNDQKAGAVQGLGFAKPPAWLASIFLCLTIGCQRQGISTGSALLERGGVWAPVGTNELIQAVKENDLPRAKFLLQGGVSPNAPDRSGSPVIFTAIHYREAQTVKLLIDFRAEVNSISDSGYPALWYASASHSAEIVRTLLTHGAAVNARDMANSSSALMAAALGVPPFDRDPSKHKENVKTLELLIQWGAEINATDDHGYTALDNAMRALKASSKNRALVDVLLKHGARRGKGLEEEESESEDAGRRYNSDGHMLQEFTSCRFADDLNRADRAKTSFG